jgi:hypothetical protein
MTSKEQAEYLSLVIIAAQSDDYFLEFKELIAHAKHFGLYDKVSPGDPGHEHIRDLDNPIENGIS